MIRPAQFAVALLATLAVAALAVLTIGVALSGDEGEGAASRSIKFFEYKSGVAADGYDVVAYFNEARAKKGIVAHKTEWGGAVWHFSSAKNLKTFLKDPSRYIPEYGGHCAYGVAQGYLVRGDPLAWSIRSDKLYLNYSRGVRTAWLAAAADFIADAAKEWPKLNR